MGEHSVDLSGALSLGTLGALIEGADLLVANNSGPVHVAAAVGTPVVCLYALTNPQHTPWEVPARVLNREVPCRDCLRSVCPQAHQACLLEVTPQEVAQAAMALLGGAVAKLGRGMSSRRHAVLRHMSAVLAMPAGMGEAPDRGAIDRQLGSVKRIGVLRALALGDMICATPALRALKRRFPDASITLIGLPWAREWAVRQACIDDFIAFPGHPGLPERQAYGAAWPGFLHEVRGRAFDLVVQLHGSGGITNGIVAQWHARRVAAFHGPGALCPEPGLGLPWPMAGKETERLLALVEGLGLPLEAGRSPDRLGLDFPCRASDHEEADILLAPLARRQDGGRSFVCLHPGSQWPSRRWPIERFAEVANALAEQGHALVITGVRGETPLAAALQEVLKPPALDLMGQTSLWSLGAVIQRARRMPWHKGRRAPSEGEQQGAIGMPPAHRSRLCYLRR